jgi:hypothetical protein
MNYKLEIIILCYVMNLKFVLKIININSVYDLKMTTDAQ